MRMNRKLSLGILSDEISPDFTEALRYAKLWDIPLFEIRCLRSGRVPDISREEFDEMKKSVANGDIRITALTPGVFKTSLADREKIGSELTDVLPRTIRQAQELGADTVIIFGFRKLENEPERNFQHAVDVIGKAAVLAGKEGVTLAVENEPKHWCDSGGNTAKLVKAINSKYLKANWDVCNALGTGEIPFPDGYNALKEFIINIHVKDTVSNSLISCVPVGEGVIDWRGQIAALIEDGIVGHITIETHCLPLIERTKLNIDTLRKYIDETSSRQKP